MEHLSDYLNERFPVLGMKELYASKRFLVLDDFIPKQILAALARECDNWYPDHENPFGYFRNMRRFVEEAHSSQTIRWLEGVTGLDALIGEPHLRDAGFGHGRSPWPASAGRVTLDLHFGNLAASDHRKPVHAMANRCFVYSTSINYTGEVQGIRLIYK